MPKKSRVTQELRNGFPEWTKVRSDDQSIGATFINAIGLEMEGLFTELARGYGNMMLTTAFTGELDQLYKFALPNRFNFTVANENTLAPEYSAPTVSGLTSSGWVRVTPVLSGSTKEFWYDALPSRLEEVDVFSVSGLLVASGLSTDLSLTLVNSGLFLENSLTVTADGESLVAFIENRIQRSKVRIEGTNWQDQEEQEDLVFLFSESKKTSNIWTDISRIQCVDFPAESLVNVYSHQFNQPYYLDSFDTLSQLEDSRENLPLFWSIGEGAGGYSTLQLQRYSVNQATDLLGVKPSLVEYKNWDLFTPSGFEVNILDIAPVTFQEKLYAITENSLLVFDTHQELPNVKTLTRSMQNTLIKLEVSTDYPIKSEEIEVLLLLIRPVKTIVKHRLSIKYPDGAEFGVLEDGTLVPTTTTDYYSYNETADRFIRPSVFIELDDYGQHDLTMEVVYLDGTTEIVQRAVLVQQKTALAEYPLSFTASGVDIDHLNRLLILDSDNNVHYIEPRYDVMLVDFDNKELIFREKYEEVKVIK